jgi:uncharacterized protein (DUF1697 family)
MQRGAAVTVHVAFLRGINVGGRTVKKEQLVELFDTCGFSGVSTFLASGNVMFATDGSDTDDLEARIEGQLREGLDYPVPTFVRTSGAVAAIAAHEPFPEAGDTGTLHVGFLREPVDEQTRENILDLAFDDDRVAFDGRELYWHVGGRFLDSALSGRDVDRIFDDRWTIRTANTVRRIAAKLPA